MAYNIIVSAQAYEDIREGADWYDNQLNDLGIDFILEFYEEANFICENPTLHSFVDKPTRKKLMQRFPYAIYFSVEKNRKEIIIEAVWHQKRNPSRLRKRFKK